MAAPAPRKSFEFRKLLGNISDGLGGENVRSLKNLCYDYMSARQRDGFTNGLEVFNVLCEKKVIEADNPVFLVELLTNIGRVDLAEKVKEYITKLERNSDFAPSRVSATLERSQLIRIAADIGRDWKMLSRYLGLDEITIQTIQQQSQGDLKEAALQSLQKWQGVVGAEKATPQALKAALTEMKLMGIVHTHFH